MAIWKVFVIADGAPAETLTALDEVAAQDARVRVFRFDKGERHGEAWRHEALQEATGAAVCYLGDDDFWFPDHLEHMRDLLVEADFAHTRQTIVWPSYQVDGPANDIGDAATRTAMLETKYNFLGPTPSGHRLDAYRRLPRGWSPAPADLWTDLHMWRKWITADNIRFRSSMAVTTLHFPRSLRQGQDAVTGLQENAFWRAMFRDPHMREALREIMPVDERKLPLSSVVLRAAQLRDTETAQHLSSVQTDAAERVSAAHADAGRRLSAARAEADGQQSAAQSEAESRLPMAKAEAAARLATAQAEAAAQLATTQTEAATHLATAHAAATARLATAQAEAAERLETAQTEAATRLRATEAELQAIRNTFTWRTLAPIRNLWARARARMKL